LITCVAVAAAFATVWWLCQQVMDLDVEVSLSLAGLASALVTLPLAGWAGHRPERSSPEPPLPAATSVPDPVAAGDGQAKPAAVRIGVPLRNPYFVGREAMLGRLHADLAGGSTMPVQALHGLGGVGKTQLAIEYAYRYADEYDLIGWVAAGQPGLIADQVAALASALGVSADGDTPATVARVLAALRQRDRWLLVFDNAEQPKHLLPFLPGGGHVVVTSSRSGWSALAATVDVDVMTRAEAAELLTGRSPGIGSGIALAIAEMLGDLPLALEQAAAYLDQTSTPPGEYLALLRTHGEELLSRGHVLGHEYTVATVWDLSYQRVVMANPAAGELLQLCAFLGGAPIPLSLSPTTRTYYPKRWPGQPLTRKRLPT
jgi:hypothetical protein